MKQTILFIGKELKELWKTYKFLILCAVLLLFGMSSPLLAKLTPKLFSQIDLGLGAPLQLPDATFLDAYVQFFKNMTQICLIVLVLVLSGTIPQELKSGTAMLMLSKGLSLSCRNTRPRCSAGRLAMPSPQQYALDTHSFCFRNNRQNRWEWRYSPCGCSVRFCLPALPLAVSCFRKLTRGPCLPGERLLCAILPA